MEQEFYISRVAFAYYKKYAPGYVFRQECRPQDGLVFVITGELTLSLKSKTVCAKAGSILLLQRGDSYRLENTFQSATEYIVISYQAMPENTLRQFLPQRSFTTAYPQRYLDLFSAVVDLNAAYTVCTQTRLCANVQEILCCIIQEEHHRSLSVKESYAEKALTFMENRFSDPLSSEDIAAAIGISVSHLRLLFRKQYGISLMQKLNQIRVRRAKELLSSGMFTLSEVASACGFQNEYYFSRVFKKFTGISPGKY